MLPLTAPADRRHRPASVLTVCLCEKLLKDSHRTFLGIVASLPCTYLRAVRLIVVLLLRQDLRAVRLIVRTISRRVLLLMGMHVGLPAGPDPLWIVESILLLIGCVFLPMLSSVLAFVLGALLVMGLPIAPLIRLLVGTSSREALHAREGARAVLLFLKGRRRQRLAT